MWADDCLGRYFGSLSFLCHYLFSEFCVTYWYQCQGCFIILLLKSLFMSALNFLKFILLLCIAPAITFAQSAVVASGGQGEGLKGSVSYSVGQVADQHYTSGVGQIHEGVQQPFEIFSNTTGTNSPAQLAFSVYPNPTRDVLWIKSPANLPEGLQYYIVDIMGRHVLEGVIDQSLREISLKEFMPSLYTIFIRYNGILIGATPIVKID